MTNPSPEPADNHEPMVGDAPPQANVLLSNHVYDKFMAATLYFLPLFATAYFGLGQIWGFPKIEEVLGSVAVLETLLAGVVKFSRMQYNASEGKYDGEINVTDHVEEGYSDLHLQLDPRAVAGKGEVLVKVNRV